MCAVVRGLFSVCLCAVVRELHFSVFVCSCAWVVFLCVCVQLYMGCTSACPYVCMQMYTDVCTGSCGLYFFHLAMYCPIWVIVIQDLMCLQQKREGGPISSGCRDTR